MQPLSQTVAPWHDFYSLLGQASATMTGLMFVAVSVGVGVFSQNRRGALRMFLTASVVQFGCILVGCLVALSPLERWEVRGGIIVACGLFGLAYSAMAWRDSVHDGVAAKIDLEDRLWYAVAPAVGFLIEAGAGCLIILHQSLAWEVLALAMVIMLLAAVHNAWDITVWSATKRQD